MSKKKNVKIAYITTNYYNKTTNLYSIYYIYYNKTTTTSEIKHFRTCVTF